MPEYLAPGVYVEEVSFRSKSIEGVSTTTTGFVGPTRYGPVDLEPDVITSLSEFEQVYGDRQPLAFSGGGPPMVNYMWQAARAFFEEGGRRLYVSRVFDPTPGLNDGHATAAIPHNLAPEPADSSPPGAPGIRVRARFPGQPGNMRVRLTVRVGENILGSIQTPGTTTLRPTLGALVDGDVVLIRDTKSPFASPPGVHGSLYHAASFIDEVSRERRWKFVSHDSPPEEIHIFHPTGSPPHSQALDADLQDEIRIVTLTVTVTPTDPDAPAMIWSDLPLDPHHARDGTPDGLGAVFALHPGSADRERRLPIVVEMSRGVRDGLGLLDALYAEKGALRAAVLNAASDEIARSVEITLANGNDGQRPGAAAYEGKAELTTTTKTGLMSFEDVEDISIVAAPGSTYAFDGPYNADARTIMNLLISHATRMRYRIAVLDSGDNQSVAAVRAVRAKIDSTYAALYYPWVRVLDPVTRREIHLPPSGFVAGIYARNDVNRAVYKAPANEVVNLALGFEVLLNKGQQDVLNPEGINCFRFFEGRGFRLWGARTISSDPEWKYVNLRRYFAYLERSIDRGTQWAVFEPNGDALWGNVRRTIEDFLLNEWQMGALLGDRPEKAYFVRCDRSTMTQNDLDNGRLVCLIGVAPLRPAEFVIFRIGQWTADRRS